MNLPIILMVCSLAITTGAAVYYGIRYSMLRANLKNAAGQLREIGQNPEDNRILLVVHADSNTEEFLLECNHYIMENQQMRIRYMNREKKLRRQIEGISHDLRTPLTSILGYLELLEWEELSEGNRTFLAVVERKAKNLHRLTANFYDLSRLELKDYHLDMEQLELSRLVRESMLNSYTDFEQRGIDVELDCERTVYVCADRDALERILNNMIGNAIRYAESKLRVSVETAKNGQVCIVFENDTYTLSEEEVPHLFERFYMSDASRNGQGTGLGLTISRLLVEAMGGKAQAKLQQGMLRIEYYFPS